MHSKKNIMFGNLFRRNPVWL